MQRLLALAASVFVAAPSAAGIDPVAPMALLADYKALIASARRKEPHRALEALRTWPPPDVMRAAEELRADPDCVPACWQAAVLLHTESLLFERHAGAKASEKAHKRAIETLLARADARDSSFPRRWEIALGYRHQQWARPLEALQTFQEVLKRYPDDPETLTAVGAVHEFLAHMPTQEWQRHGQPASYDFRSWELSEATRHYERALSFDPEAAETRLRLGRVHVVAGRLEEGRRELLHVTERPMPPRLHAYARLFLGDAAERESRLDEAIAQYRAALQADPRLQAAHFALAHALETSGRRDEASQALIAGLRATREGARAWINSHHGHAAAAERLWAEVSE